MTVPTSPHDTETILIHPSPTTRAEIDHILRRELNDHRLPIDSVQFTGLAIDRHPNH